MNKTVNTKCKRWLDLYDSDGNFLETVHQTIEEARLGYSGIEDNLIIKKHDPQRKSHTTLGVKC